MAVNNRRALRRLLPRRCIAWILLLAGFAGTCQGEWVWGELPQLPDAIGFGGAAAGVHNDALIVAGGANFPSAPPWEGGAKVWHDSIYVLGRGTDGEIRDEWTEGGRLPKRLAYGVAVSTDDGMLIVGGEEEGRPVADVYCLAWRPAEQRVAIKRLPDLPAPAAYAAGGRIGSVVYVAASTRSIGADRLDEKHFWSLDLAQWKADPNTTWKSLPAWPGAARHKAVAAVQATGSGQEHLFLISGESPRYTSSGEPDLSNFRYHTDAYRYDPTRQAWDRIADLPALPEDRDVPALHPDARWPVAAGTGIGVGQSHVLVFSGSTGRYITEPPEKAPPFPRKVLAYHTITDTWTDAGDMPLGVVTTSITRWGKQIVIPSGEIRPGVRTRKVQSLRITGDVAAFGALNYTVVGVYLVGMLAVGGYFAYRTRSTDDFFRGGQRVPFWVAGLSIFATMLSSITFVSLPAKAFATDWMYYVSQLSIIPVAFVVVALAIPFFRRLDATSAYEYLEKRFNRPVRLIASAQFVMFQIGRMAIVMYLPALALSTITPFSVIECVLLMGVLSVVYCTLGGVEAVVWTDAIQTLVLMGGLFCAIVVVIANVDGGISELATTSWHDNKLHLADIDFSLSSYTTTAVWVIFIGQFFQSLYSYTADQAVVQRYMTTSSERDARNAMWTTAWMGVVGTLLFFTLGSALYVFYKQQPMALEIGMKNDAIFPLFIASQLPVGLSGLVIAGVFAAAQSTISTSMNSTATAIVADFCMPFKLCRTDAGYLILARILTALLGVAGTYFACALVWLNEPSMFDTFIKVVGLFGGAVCGLFLLGMLTRRTTAYGGLCGAVCGFGSVLWAMWYTNIHHFLYAMIGTLVTMAVGYAISLFMPAPAEQNLAGLTVYDRLPTNSGSAIHSVARLGEQPIG